MPIFRSSGARSATPTQRARVVRSCPKRTPNLCNFNWIWLISFVNQPNSTKLGDFSHRSGWSRAPSSAGPKNWHESSQRGIPSVCKPDLNFFVFENIFFSISQKKTELFFWMNFLENSLIFRFDNFAVFDNFARSQLSLNPAPHCSVKLGIL